MPIEQREREVLQRRAAEEEQRADRQQRDERRGERPADRLPERDVDDRRERRAPHDRHVLADAVEDDDRVVDRVTEHGQHRGDRRFGHLPPCQRVDADRDQDVVQHRDDHRHREREAVEPQRDVERDHEQREDDREDRRARDLLPEARRRRSSTLELSRVHLLRRDRSSSLFCSAVVSFLTRIWKLVYLSPPVDLPRPWTTASLRPIAAVCSRTLRERRRLRRLERDLHAAPEVDAEVEARSRARRR